MPSGATPDDAAGTRTQHGGSKRADDARGADGRDIASNRVEVIDPGAAEPRDCVADHASDSQLAAWLDVAASPLRDRRAFAVDCNLFRERHPSPMKVDARAGADFASDWLRARARPESYRREVDSNVPAKRQGPYGLARVAALRRWRCMPNRHLLTLLDADYPKRLRHLDDPPPVLYVQGAIAWLHTPMIAIVGSRRASAQGQESAGFLASEISRRGWSIVSGLADGIDAAAHKATLQGAQRQASTVAVIGTGIDQIYPTSNTALRDAIGQHGAILSEWPLGTPPKAAHFPQRNRLIAALAHGVVVVEAALRSGSLITARLANELGRDVFALPGSIFSPQARGCHALIKEGATLVENVDDILDGLPQHDAVLLDHERPLPVEEQRKPSTSPVTARAPRPRHMPTSPHATSPPLPPLPCTPEEEPQDIHEGPILAALGHDAVALDVLCVRTGLSAATVAARLAIYEIDGRVSSTGGRFSALFATDQRTMDRNVLKSTLAAKRARRTENGPFRSSTGNVVESAADSAPRQTEADESAIRPGQS
jgi:DNA processing protein